MAPRVTKHFVTAGTRRVHYHRAGEGPVVALLHASPCSAKVMRLPLEIFASRFTALAFDTPGFDLSDLLPLDEPETTQPCLLMAAPEDPFARCLAQARAARPDARIVEVEDSPESRAGAMQALLSG